MRNDACFLDTSGWIAFLNGDDRNHASAVDAYVSVVGQGRILVVTDWVMAETGNGLARSRLRDPFVISARLFATKPGSRIVTIDAGLRRSALDLYHSRPDKAWGLVDCASFVVMNREGIREAITADRHFEQAGFRCLLPGPPGQGGTNGPIR